MIFAKYAQHEKYEEKSVTEVYTLKLFGWNYHKIGCLVDFVPVLL